MFEFPILFYAVCICIYVTGNLEVTAGVVGLIIWRIAYQKKLWGINSQRRTSGPIKVTNQNCMKWGICGNAKNIALKNMEKSGLIRLDTKRGRSPIVQIIDDECIS